MYTVANRRAVVVGAGVAGLASARALCQRGWKVVVVAQHGPLDTATTSQGAGGLWMPFHIEPAVESARWAAETLRVFLREKDTSTEYANSIRVLPVVSMKRAATPSNELPEWADIPELDFRSLSREEMLQKKHFSPYTPSSEWWGAWCFHAPVVHAEPYLEVMVRELKEKHQVQMSFGHHFTSLLDAYECGRQLLGEGSPVEALVNCTGLGANEICSSDQGVIPGRGVVLKAKRPAGCDAVILCEEAPFTEQSPAYAIPRGEDLITLGGTYYEGDYSQDVAEHEIEDIKEKARFLYPKQFGGAESSIEVEKVWAGLRPVRHAGLRLEVQPLNSDVKVLHNFGAGGGGWTVMHGCAREGVDMLETSLGIASSKL